MNFDELADNTIEGIHFKDEGSFLTVKFDKATHQPITGNAMYEFGSLAEVSLSRQEVRGSRNIEQLKTLLIQKYQRQL